ncbi:phage/plasmid primase, P4 family [Aeromicrobium sp. HA]|uniref:phage/plasmid primase, P4 family n=1 Tax=Aeromicrobium sp. HA TaxID=3009077 RepID=UPI0022AF42ED|nr:phage/plasmid primase, P4 family [Aeromicrobium sp. HA]
MSIFPPRHAAKSENRDLGWSSLSLAEFFECAQAEVEAGRAWPDDSIVMTTVEATPTNDVDKPVDEVTASDAYGPGPPESDGLIYAKNALHYLGLGYSPLPLPARAKTPPPNGYTGTSAPMATEDEVRDWCVDRPDANIALRLPDTVVAIDVDATDGKTGVETMRAAVAKLGKLPLLGRSTASTETKGHGHYLFRVPAGTLLVENLNRLFGAHVDVIQHTHRYIVAPPSIHPKGHAYEWDSAEHPKFPAVDQLPELPHAWLAALSRVERDADDGGVKGGDRTEYETFSDSIRADVDAHTSTEVDRTLAKLEALKALPDGARDEDGRGWHDGIRDYTKYLARLCCAPWSPVLPADLIPRLEESLPHDAGKPLHEGLSMFAAAVESGDGADLPAEFGAAMLMAAVGERAPGADSPTVQIPTCVNRADSREWPLLERIFAPRFRRASDVQADIAAALAPQVQRVDGAWYVWTGSHWARDFGGETASRHVTSLLDAQPTLTEPKPTRADAGAVAPTPYSKAIAAEAALSAARVLAKVASHEVLVTDSTFDTEPLAINTPAGLLDLATGEVTAHDPSMLVSRIARASYRPGATHRHLDFLLGLHDPEVARYLQVVCGAALTGYADHRLTLLVGPGGNGKTTLLGALAAAMGDYAFKGTGKDLDDVTRNPTSFLVPQVFEGRRLVVFEELARGGYLDAAVLKRYVGGGIQGGAGKYESRREWAPTSSVVVNANVLPHVSEAGRSVQRRLRAIPLAGSIPDGAQDPTIEDAMRTDPACLEAVFVWAVEGARAFIANGCVIPPPADACEPVAAATEEWFGTSDTVGRFVDETLEEVADTDRWIPLSEIRARFEEFWAEEHGTRDRQMRPTDFYRELRENHGVEIYGGASSAKNARRPMTRALLDRLDPSAGTILAEGEKAVPVFGWRFRDGRPAALKVRDVVAALSGRDLVGAN